jgi:hypothetical protein
VSFMIFIASVRNILGTLSYTLCNISEQRRPRGDINCKYYLEVIKDSCGLK